LKNFCDDVLEYSYQEEGKQVFGKLDPNQILPDLTFFLNTTYTFEIRRGRDIKRTRWAERSLSFFKASQPKSIQPYVHEVGTGLGIVYLF
jgi:hypothetical protein